MRGKGDVAGLTGERSTGEVADGFGESRVALAFFHDGASADARNLDAPERRWTRGVRHESGRRAKRLIELSGLGAKSIEARVLTRLMNRGRGILRGAIAERDHSYRAEKIFGGFAHALQVARAQRGRDFANFSARYDRVLQPSKRLRAEYSKLGGRHMQWSTKSAKPAEHKRHRLRDSLRNFGYDFDAPSLRNARSPANADIPTRPISGSELAVCGSVLSAVALEALMAWVPLMPPVTGADHDVVASGSELGYASFLPGLGMRTRFAEPMRSASAAG